MPVSSFSNTVVHPYRVVSAAAAIDNVKRGTAKSIFGNAAPGVTLGSGLLNLLRIVNRSKLVMREPAPHTARFTNQPEPRRFAATLEFAALTLVAVIAVSNLARWIFPAIDRLVPSFWSRVPSCTAAALFFAAGCLGLLMLPSPVARRFAASAAGIVLGLGIFQLFNNIAYFSPAPCPPAVFSGLAFILLGICMLGMRQSKNRWPGLIDAAALLFLALNFVLLGIAVFGALHNQGGNGVCPQTLFALCCLSGVLLPRRVARDNWLSGLANTGIGGGMTRIILPVALVMPFALLAAEAALVRSGRLNEVYAESVTAAIAAVLGVCLVVWTARRIAALESDLRDLSLTDELTGVYNRRGFYFLGQQAIRDAERGQTGLTLYYFDLDGLKKVNDTLGHEAGSEMIKAFTAVLNSTFRKSDIIGRVGGDEFAVVTIRDDGLAPEAVHARLDHFTRMHNEPHGQRYHLGFSVGQAELNKGSGETLDSLVARADGLMYRAKLKKKQRASAWLEASKITIDGPDRQNDMAEIAVGCD